MSAFTASGKAIATSPILAATIYVGLVVILLFAVATSIADLVGQRDEVAGTQRDAAVQVAERVGQLGRHGQLEQRAALGGLQLAAAVSGADLVVEAVFERLDRDDCLVHCDFGEGAPGYLTTEHPLVAVQLFVDRIPAVCHLCVPIGGKPGGLRGG